MTVSNFWSLPLLHLRFRKLRLHHCSLHLLLYLLFSYPSIIQNHRKAKLPQINLQQNTNVVLVLFLCDMCSARDLEASVRDSLSSTILFE